MKQLLLFRRYFVSFLFLAVSTLSWANGTKIDGIYYVLNNTSKTASVTFTGTYSDTNPTSTAYSGNVTIPETITYNSITYCVTSIGVGAFRDCSSLTSITIPNSVTSIGASAFWECSGLTSITIPNSVTSIGSSAFYGCSGLTSVTIPNSVTSIVYRAFYGCSGLTSITIGNSVTSIGQEAFDGCSSLTSLTIPNSVTSIGNDAFRACSALTSVTIPNSVTSIGRSAFYACSGLTSVTIGNSVTSIGQDAFDGCSGLTKAEFASIESLCKIEFAYNSNPLKCAKHLYINGQEVTDLIIPNSVTGIGNYAFYGCSSLTSVTIPNSVTSIGGYAFWGCSGLTSVTIGNSVRRINDNAFMSCTSLWDVYCYSDRVPNTSSSAFEGVDIDYIILHVPASAIEDYRAKEPWGNFWKIVALDGGQTYKRGDVNGNGEVEIGDVTAILTIMATGGQ